MKITREDEALVERLKGEISEIEDDYWNGLPITKLLATLTEVIDRAIKSLWIEVFGNEREISLFAIGGYGRGEMFPRSDIDLLILTEDTYNWRPQIEDFIQRIYNFNFEIGHSVRTIEECVTEMKNDISVETAVMERRHLEGSKDVSRHLSKRLGQESISEDDDYFGLKEVEQNNRHKQFQNVDYGLEPNIKNSPGGLRDIHTLIWIALKRHKTTSKRELVKLGVLTRTESRLLAAAEKFLRHTRFGLHLISKNKEDRLRFMYQRELSAKLGYRGSAGRPDVERFMQKYYRHVLAIQEINTIVIQSFRENLSKVSKPQTKINPRFNLVENYIEVARESVFKETPSALIEIFVIMAKRRDIVGVNSSTIRLIRESVSLIDEDFRNDRKIVSLFIDLLTSPFTLVTQLTRMRKYGVLGRYLPEFGKIVGRMQHDLFHIYTVDAHTMMVIQNMRQFRYRSTKSHSPIAYHCVHKIPKPELLYIAGLFHDIGKGRGGNHSELGKEDARAFCARHRINRADTDLVVWLVEKHLMMSATAQQKDIYDPQEIKNFAAEVGSEMRLNYLYALTEADIKATNDTLWNSWRASLLRHLFIETRKILRFGEESIPGRKTTVNACKRKAREKIRSVAGFISTEVQTKLWTAAGEDFFLRHTPNQVSEITISMLTNKNLTETVVEVRDANYQLSIGGATNIYIRTPDRKGVFAATTSELDKLNLSIVDASINSNVDGLCLNRITVLMNDGEPVPRSSLVRSDIKTNLTQTLSKKTIEAMPHNRRTKRQIVELSRSTEVSVEAGSTQSNSLFRVLASDRPGLLGMIASWFYEYGFDIQSAKINTLGERVEDIFSVEHAEPLSKGVSASLEDFARQLERYLDSRIGIKTKKIA